MVHDDNDDDETMHGWGASSSILTTNQNERIHKMCVSTTYTCTVHASSAKNKSFPGARERAESHTLHVGKEGTKPTMHLV